MKRRILFGFILTVGLFITVSALGQVQEDIQKHPHCKYCGMDRGQFAHSRVYIEYDDGTTAGACSLRCAALDLALNIDKTPKIFQVGDYETKRLINAEKAIWVLGGKKMGVMTKRAKWTFAEKENAEKFVRGESGEIISFDEAMKAAYEDMYADTKMIRDKRKMMQKKMEHKPQ